MLDQIDLLLRDVVHYTNQIERAQQRINYQFKRQDIGKLKALLISWEKRQFYWREKIKKTMEKIYELRGIKTDYERNKI